MNPAGRVLIVDDDEGMRLTVQYVLADRGHEVVSAPSGAAALAAIQEQTFDVALIDLSLPDIAGEELIAEVRRASPETALIVITGFASVDSAVEAVNERVRAYLRKPFEMPDLIQRVEAELEARHLQLEHRRMTARLVTLNQIGALAGRSLDLNETMPECVALLADAVEADWAEMWVALPTDNCAPVGTAGACRLNREEIADGVRALLEQRDPPNGRIRIARNDLPALSIGPDEALLIPLEAQAQPIGAIGLQWSDGRTIESHDGELLGTAVERLAAAAQNSRLYQELQQSLVQLERAQKTLVRNEKLATAGALIAGVAHELNNPLTAILGFSEYLASIQPTEVAASAAQRVSAQARRCARIVENLLAFARQYESEREPVDLNQVIRDAVELQAYHLRVDNMEVKLDLDPALPMTEADPHRLQQVVINLITNAHHAMRETEGAHVLSISTRAVDGRLVAEFSDTGPGIPADILPLVFDPFFTTKKLGEGTGLGLSICYGIITEHGGTIEALNGEQGATFRIELPIVTPVAEQDEKPTDPEQEESVCARILVVDDEEVVVELLQRVLGEDGHWVRGVTDGRTAQELLANEDFDLVISDVKMPGMDGAEFHAYLQSVRPDLAARTIFMTGDRLSPDTAEFLRSCNARLLEKPFDRDKLEAVIQEALAEDDNKLEGSALHLCKSGNAGEDQSC